MRIICNNKLYKRQEPPLASFAMKTIQALKDKGYRITEQRKKILEVMRSHPLTAQEIFELLEKHGEKIDLASVYRTLHLLTHMGIVTVVEIREGKKRYELVKDHHHHLICDNCGTIEDIMPIGEEGLMKEIQGQTQFQITNHSLEFFGLCTRCQ